MNTIAYLNGAHQFLVSSSSLGASRNVSLEMNANI